MSSTPGSATDSLFLPLLGMEMHIVKVGDAVRFSAFHTSTGMAVVAAVGSVLPLQSFLSFDRGETATPTLQDRREVS